LCVFFVLKLTQSMNQWIWWIERSSKIIIWNSLKQWSHLHLKYLILLKTEMYRLFCAECAVLYFKRCFVSNYFVTLMYALSKSVNDVLKIKRFYVRMHFWETFYYLSVIVQQIGSNRRVVLCVVDSLNPAIN
jgi:hypothetical protein